MEELSTWCDKYQFAFILLGGSIGPIVGWAFKRVGRATAAWCASTLGVVFLIGVLAVDRFDPATQTFKPPLVPEVLEGEGEQNHAEPNSRSHDQPDDKPQIATDFTESRLVQGLNRARLTGVWVGHSNGSYTWVSHAILLRGVDNAGRPIVNESDSAWVLDPEYKPVQKADGSIGYVPDPDLIPAPAP